MTEEEAMRRVSALAGRLQTERTNRYNAALETARIIIMGDGKRAEAVEAIVEQHGLSEEEAHQLVTAAQNGYLRQIQIRNPEAWDELGLGPVPDVG